MDLSELNGKFVPANKSPFDVDTIVIDRILYSVDGNAPSNAGGYLGRLDELEENALDKIYGCHKALD